ncbi:MAG: hypothetical protein MZU95_08595 [Desulfomicrobium escambiense]|nr:hypothetical protein [Desulfomicrobium escambiense]
MERGTGRIDLIVVPALDRETGAGRVGRVCLDRSRGRRGGAHRFRLPRPG